MSEPRKRALARTAPQQGEHTRTVLGAKGATSYLTRGPIGTNQDAGQAAAEGTSELASPPFAFCVLMEYLGIDSQDWKEGVEHYVKGIWEAYAKALDAEDARDNFKDFANELRNLELLDVLKQILEFLLEGEISLEITLTENSDTPFKIETTAEFEINVIKETCKIKIVGAGVKVKSIKVDAIGKLIAKLLKPVREKLLELLARAGLKGSVKIVASAIRKAMVVSELIFASYCFGKCSARVIDKWARATWAGLERALDAIGKLAATVLTFPFLLIKARLKRSNLVLKGGLPDEIKLRVQTILDWLLQNEATTDVVLRMKRLTLQPLKELGTAGNDVLNQVAEGSAIYHSLPVNSILAEIGSFSTLQLVNYLVDRQLLYCLKDPELMASEAAAAGTDI